MVAKLPRGFLATEELVMAVTVPLGLGRIYAGALRFGRVDAVTAAALGVFDGFQITNFDGFFRCHVLSF